MTTTDSSNLAQLKATFNLASNKMKRLDTPQEELQQICEAIRDAVATNRMENEPEFAKFVYEELAIGLMQKLAKTTSFDSNVSKSFPAFLLCPALTLLMSCMLVCECLR